MGLQNRRASWVRVHLAAGSHENYKCRLSWYIWKAWNLQGNLICCPFWCVMINVLASWIMWPSTQLVTSAPSILPSIHPSIHLSNPSTHWKPLLTQLWMKIHLDLSYHANPPTLLAQVDKWHSYLVSECKWFLQIADSCKFHQIWSHPHKKKRRVCQM
jgi:hypothetical protein